ncbi:cytoplasmic dynein 2 intermediate chain 2-like [Dermacentor andersoni]|uniref:cytoplasmic dynein 2 intermediate chain 2-like n=1 Tax=Dermacentor andersoni TaxID=34620 RepID=UPI0024173938|nr:cytoplasmic dynein 2 intermediate chain 2-like [Dermacentor andersoni]
MTSSLTITSSTCGVANHDEWCTHEAGVFLWNPHRSHTFNQTGGFLPTDTCVTSVAFHPQRASVLVAGTVHGDIMIWDMQNTSDQWASSPNVMHDNHRDLVKCVEWIGNAEDSNFLLSCGLDGMVIQWRHDTRKSNLEVVNYFLLLAENVRLNKQVPSGGSGTHVGVTSLAKNHFDDAVFVMGTEGGGVLQGSLSLSRPIASLVVGHGSLERTYSCPVVARFPPHRGHTLDVHSSPFERNVFASGGMDREVKVFSLLQLEPVLTIPLPEAAIRVRWSPSQPTLLAALQGDGRLDFYDLRRTTAPVAEFPLNTERGAGTSLEYCARSPDLVFVSRGPGNTQVWQLGSKLVAAGEVNQSDLIRDVANGTFASE